MLDKEDDKNPDIIPLKNFSKITLELSPANQMTIFTDTRTVTLKASNEADLMKWARALEHVAFKYKTKPENHASVMEEENDLYCPAYADGDGIFTVNLLESDAILYGNCILKPKKYTIQLTCTEIQLKNLNSVDIVARWPYQYIRNYKCVDDQIKFEAGRKCVTGEGEFIFQHSNPKHVFRCLRKKMKAMKKSMSVATWNGDGEELSAAMSMEPGSRCPLIYDGGDASQNSHLIFGFLSSNPMTSSSTVTASMKIIPLKPTRKSLLTDSNEKPTNSVDTQLTPATGDYEPIEEPRINDLSRSFRRKAVPQTLTLVKCRIQNQYDYENIETPSNAWESLGMSDVEYKESQSPDMSREVPSLMMDSFSTISAADEQYDKLDFFAPNQLTPSSDYPKLMVDSTANSYKKFAAMATSDDYEIIGENTMNELKFFTSQQFVEDDDLLNHSQVNGLDYAIVSKPKQV